MRLLQASVSFSAVVGPLERKLTIDIVHARRVLRLPVALGSQHLDDARGVGVVWRVVVWPCVDLREQDGRVHAPQGDDVGRVRQGRRRAVAVGVSSVSSLPL